MDITGKKTLIVVDKPNSKLKPGRCTSLRLILKAVYQNCRFIKVIGPSVDAVWV